MKPKFDELILKLRQNVSQQSVHDWIEDVYNEYLKDNYKEVATDIDIQKHRWYETSIIVIEVFGQFLGIRLVSKMYSEMSDLGDVCWSYEFLRMEQMQVISYKIADNEKQ